MSNANFTKVDSLAGQLSDLNVADARVDELTAHTINADLTYSSSGWEHHTIVGFVPGPFVGAAAAHNLNTTQGTAQAVSLLAGDLLVLPLGAVVLGAYVDNNGTTIAGPASFGIGWNPALAVTATNIATALLLATANVGGAVGFVGTALASAGAALAASLAANMVVSVTPSALVSAGDLRVTVEFLLRNTTP